MKRIIIGLIAIIPISILIFTGCNKEEVSKPVTTSKKKMLNAIEFRPFEFYTLGTQILESDFLNNDHDINDQNFNYVEYGLVLALLEVQNNPTLSQIIVEKVMSKPAKMYNLYTLAQEHPELNPIINQVFQSRFSDFSAYQSNWVTYLEAKYRYDKQYIPFVSLLNRGEVNPSKPVHIAGAYEINEEKFEDFRNELPLFTYGRDPNKITIINEDQAVIIDNPILTINNGSLGDETNAVNHGTEINGDLGTVTAERCNNNTHLHEYIDHKKFSIHDRYEATGYSEYTVLASAAAFYNSNTLAWTAVSSWDTPSIECSRDVHKNDVNKVIDWPFIMFSPDMFSNAPNSEDKCFDINNQPQAINCYFGFGAYERDWGRNQKVIYNFCHAFGTDQGRGRRKFDSEVYFFDVINNNSYPFGVRHPNQHSTWSQNYKGYIQTHRWNL